MQHYNPGFALTTVGFFFIVSLDTNFHILTHLLKWYCVFVIWINKLAKNSTCEWLFCLSSIFVFCIHFLISWFTLKLPFQIARKEIGHDGNILNRQNSVAARQDFFGVPVFTRDESQNLFLTPGSEMCEKHPPRFSYLAGGEL